MALRAREEDEAIGLIPEGFMIYRYLAIALHKKAEQLERNSINMKLRGRNET
jgi:hypothetical protein